MVVVLGDASHLSFITYALVHTHYPHLHLYTMVQTADSDFKVGLLLYVCLSVRSGDTAKTHCPFTIYLSFMPLILRHAPPLLSIP